MGIKVLYLSTNHVFYDRICYQPASITVRAIDITVRYLESNYEHPDTFVHLGPIREQIFTLLMSMRTDENYHLGVEEPCTEGRALFFGASFPRSLDKLSKDGNNCSKSALYLGIS